MKHLWDLYQPVGGQNSDSQRFHHPDLASEQLSLFWFQDPNVVITAIQFMQFGYAIALSIVVVFWESMNDARYFAAIHYVIAVLVCYALFVVAIAQVIPKYTMATSLGQVCRSLIAWPLTLVNLPSLTLVFVLRLSSYLTLLQSA